MVGALVLNMVNDKQHFPNILRFYYRNTVKKYCSNQKEIDRCVWGRCADSTPVTELARFRSGNFNVENAPCSERPIEADTDAKTTLVDANRCDRIEVKFIKFNIIC